MRKIFAHTIVVIVLLMSSLVNNKGYAQDLHFTQYYNTPMLLNPANTALMSEDNFRIGAIFRNQWATIPVPYNSTSIFTDFQLIRNPDRNNWLGIGLAVYNDKAGDGNLSLFNAGGSVAYHLQIGEGKMLSAGISGAYVHRSINFAAFSYDSQWDGFTFDKSNPNNERIKIATTNFFDLGAGVNYALFPNKNTYIKMGLGLAHLTQPVESFLGSPINTVGIRTTGSVDALLHLTNKLTINPSTYFTLQTGAWEMLFGTLVITTVSEEENGTTQLILGGYYRMEDAVIGVAGLKWNNFKLTASYDFTVSSLTAYNQGYGAVEIGLIYQSSYVNTRGRLGNSMNCPRF
jgi:type IX secretion system PorP/SprF family membrane protein